MKISTLSLRKYTMVCCVLLLSGKVFSQIPDFKVQHLQDDIGRTGGSNTSFTSVSSINNAVAIANNNRKSHAGENGATSTTYDGNDLSGARVLTGTGTLSYYRESASANNNMRFNTSIWEYIGAPGGNNEMIVRGRYVVNLNGATNSVTEALSGISNANNCIPFITGIINNSTDDDADSGTAIAYLQNATTLRVLKGSDGNNVTVYVTVVEFTGSNWNVLHGDSGSVSNDTGTLTLTNNSNGTGTATNVSSWSDAIIFSQHIGDTDASGTNDAIADNWPLMEPGNNNQRVDWTFDDDHDSAGTNRHFVHVLTNTALNVTRYQDTSNSADESTINITSAGLTDVNQALIVGCSKSSGTGKAYGRGWRNYYLNSTIQAAHWAHRSGNTSSHEIQIVDLSGLTTTITGPEINITGNSNTINDGDTTPSPTDDTDFGNVNVSAGTQINTFTIQNVGTTSLSVGSITISGTHASDFNITASPTASVAASGSTNFDITFNPSAAGLRTASISIVNGDSDENPYNFNIEGTGTVPTYCVSSGTNSDGYTDNVRYVNFNTINNSSPNTDIGYTDFTGVSTTVTQGSAYNLNVNVNTTGGYTYHVIAWIDWNQNADFTDPGESYDLGTAYNVTNGPPNGSPLSITIPGTSTLGSTRMRISTRWAGDATSCETGFDGEVEDYTINIIASTPTPEINILGNGNTIVDGDTTPSVTDDTDFGSILTTAGSQINTFTIENIGSSNLNLTGGSPYVSITGTNAGDFSLVTIPSSPIATSGSTTFQITFDPSASGLRSATLTIANNDSDENPYNFNIEGTGVAPLACTSTETSFPYTEGFESGLGAWIQDTGDDINWTNNSGGTPSYWTGPSSAYEGSDYMYTEATGNLNSTAILVSPCFDLSTETGAEFTFYYNMYGSQMGDLYVEISTNNGASWPTTLWSQSGDQGTAWLPATIDLDPYVGQTIMLRFRGETSNDYRSDIAIDAIELTTIGVPSPEINITGLGQNINDGDTTPSVTDDTDFGTIDVIAGTNANTFTIENIGTASLSIGTLTIGGANAADFTVTASPSSSVANSSNTTFEITFNPSANGLREASISIVNGDSDENPYNFNIQGTGFTPVPEINITGNGNSITDGDITPSLTDDTDFGNIDVASGTNANTFTIHNTGTASLSVGSITISGAHATDFTVTSSPSASVTASGNTSFNITFNPSATGLRTASVSIINGDSNENPYNFNIQGTGTVPTYSNVNVSLDWPSFAYENRVEFYDPDGILINSYGYIGDFSDSTTLNLGCLEDLNNYYFIMYDSANDGWDGSDNITITGGASTLINQDGNTASSGFGTTVFFNVSGGGAGSEIEITGNGTTINDGDTTPAVADDTDFGTVDVASGTNANTFTINNIGCSDLNLTAASPFMTISGTNAADFSITTIPSALITSGNSTTFEITFNPSATGLRTATISIANNDSDENPYHFNIEGTGYTAVPEINITGNGNTINDGDIFPSTTDDTEFPAVSVTGSTHTNTFTIQNTGGATLNVGSITIAGFHASDFTVTASPSSSVAPSGSTAFNITFDPSAIGLRTANITVANNDSDESTYYFNIQGYGITPGVCTTTIVSYPYSESFETGLGLWSQDINGVNDDFDWTRTNVATSSTGTGPSRAQDGNYYMYTEATGNSNSTAQLVSPCFDLTSASNPRFTFFYHMHGSVTSGGWSPTTTNYMGDLNVEVSTDNGLSYGSAVFTQSGYAQQNSNTLFTPISVDLSSYIGQTIKIRLRGDTSGDSRSDMAIDMVTLTDKPTPIVAPGGVTSDLALWLKANDGLSYSNGQNVSAWEDQGLGSDARVMRNGQRPTYYDNTTKNVNFNPVIEFDNSYTTLSLDGDYSHDSTSSEFLSGDYGFYTQEVFIVLIPDDTPINRTFGFMDVFCSDAHLDTSSTDATGLGFGNYTNRINNEIICYAHDSYDNSSGDGYAVAEIGTGSSYDNIGIINTRNNTANTQQELYYNANDIGTTQNDIVEYTNTNDSRWWIGRSEGWEASLNARVAEVITYSSRKVDTDLTQERNRIQSYLGIKYGITLGVNGTTQDYVNSDGSVIWDQSANIGYNYDIAGIGRDDVSGLNQKQSRSVNNASDSDGRTEGVLTIGLTDIYDTNKLNQSGNATTFGDKEYLVWGNNGADLDLAASVISVNMSSGISPALTTNVSFTAMQRIWKVVETGGDVATAKVRIPQNAIRNITPPGNFYMFISSTGVFDPTADYRVMTDDGNGNLETDYDFDNTKYITFGYAPQVIVERSIYFDGAVDYVDMEDALDLNPSQFTISAWIKRDAADSGTKSIVSKRNTAFTQGYDFRILNDNRIEVFWKNGSNQTLTSTTAIPDDEWHQVAVTYNGTTARLYIDGIEDSSGSKSAPVNTNESFYIAAAGKGTSVQHFRGNIDEVRVWDRMLTPNQLRFIMNQEIDDNSSIVAGKVLPTSISKNDIDTIPWSDLAGYYPMSVYTYTNTEDASGNHNQGALRNLNTVDRQTAPLPYESTQNGKWDLQSTWKNGSTQTIPGTTSIVDSDITVDWNIIKTNHNVTIDDDSDLPASKNGNRTVLGLMVESNTIEVSGVTDATTNTGYGLTVSHYLDLTGTIDLEGESQLIQTEDSDLIVANSGRLERDQQGTADTFTYNYWSSPVGQTDMETNEFRYKLSDVMQGLGYLTSGYNGSASPLRIADYWVWTFSNLANGDYSAWQHTRSTGNISAGEGFTMKGPGSGPLTSDQNYVFNGKPNNGHIDLTIHAGNNYLVGNPYPSAIDAVEFINDNLGSTTGTLYFWEHWGGGNHILADYQGGYALMNLSGGTPSVTLGQPVAGVSNTGTPRKTPGRYISVSQGFFVVADAGGPVVFENDQRQFQKEDGTLNGDSVFFRANETTNNYETEASGDPRMKFRIGIYTVNTIQRQLLLTIDPNATTSVDLGYDGILNETQMDDMFWMISGDKYIIQGSNDAEIDTTYPLGIKTDTEGLNTISINGLENVPDDMDLFIHDIENNSYHNLRESDFEINLPAGEYLDRFEMTFREINDTLSIDDNELSTLDVYYSNEAESLVLLNPNYEAVKSIELFNMIGQSIHTIKDISELDYSEYEVKNLSTGTYIVKINTASGSVSKKVLVK